MLCKGSKQEGISLGKSLLAWVYQGTIFLGVLITSRAHVGELLEIHFKKI
jgi:hypothetical protein